MCGTFFSSSDPLNFLLTSWMESVSPHNSHNSANFLLDASASLSRSEAGLVIGAGETAPTQANVSRCFSRSAAPPTG